MSRMLQGLHQAWLARGPQDTPGGHGLLPGRYQPFAGILEEVADTEPS